MSSSNRTSHPFSTPYGGPHTSAPGGVPPSFGNPSSLDTPSNTVRGSRAYPFIVPPSKDLESSGLSKIDQLYGMGFTDRNKVIEALQANKGDVNRTVDHLLSTLNLNKDSTEKSSKGGGALEEKDGAGGRYQKGAASGGMTFPTMGVDDASSTSPAAINSQQQQVDATSQTGLRFEKSGSSSSEGSTGREKAPSMRGSISSLNAGGWEDVNGLPYNLTNAASVLDLLDLSSFKKILVDQEKFESVDDLFYLHRELDTADAIKLMQSMGIKVGEAIRLLRVLKEFGRSSIRMSSSGIL